jgi:hypothetical protein
MDRPFPPGAGRLIGLGRTDVAQERFACILYSWREPADQWTYDNGLLRGSDTSARGDKWARATRSLARPWRAHHQITNISFRPGWCVRVSAAPGPAWSRTRPGHWLTPPHPGCPRLRQMLVLAGPGEHPTNTRMEALTRVLHDKSGILPPARVTPLLTSARSITPCPCRAALRVCASRRCPLVSSVPADVSPAGSGEPARMELPYMACKISLTWETCTGDDYGHHSGRVYTTEYTSSARRCSSPTHPPAHFPDPAPVREVRYYPTSVSTTPDA